MSEGKKTDRLPGLDGLRGLAILLVIGGHAWMACGSENPLWAYPAMVFGNASFGVRLFFVLSGFLITSLLLAEEKELGSISLAKFYGRRVLRIFPAFYVYLMAMWLLRQQGIVDISNSQLLSAGTYSWNYHGVYGVSGPSEGEWFLGHLWTLSLEEQFYLFWPAVMLLCGSQMRWRIALGIPLLMPLVRLGIYFMYPSQRGYLGMMMHTAIDSIIIGCALALWQARSTTGFEGLRRRPAICLLAAVFVFLVSPCLGEWIRSYRVTVGFLLDGLCASILIVWASTPGSRSWCHRFLDSPPLVGLGLLSYSLYLWQQPFFSTLNHHWSGVFPINVAATLALACASYFLVERPMLRLKCFFTVNRPITEDPVSESPRGLKSLRGSSISDPYSAEKLGSPTDRL